MIKRISLLTKTTAMQIRPYLLPALILCLVQGCSFSTSSGSSSDSSDSSSKSSSSITSSSASSSEDSEKYQLQIMSYTTAYLTTTTFDRFAFSRGIYQIATANGIISWEDDEATLTAIGRGLKNSGITDHTYESYKNNIANSDTDRMKMIQKGYDM